MNRAWHSILLISYFTLNSCETKTEQAVVYKESLEIAFWNQHLQARQENMANHSCRGFETGIRAMIPYFVGGRRADTLNSIILTHLIPEKFLSGEFEQTPELLQSACSQFLEDSLNRLPAFLTLGLEEVIYQDSTLVGFELVGIVDACGGILSRIDTYYLWVSLENMQEIHAGNVGRMPLHDFLLQGHPVMVEDENRFKRLLGIPNLFNEAEFTLREKGMEIHLNSFQTDDFEPFTCVLAQPLADSLLPSDFPRPW